MKKLILTLMLLSLSACNDKANTEGTYYNDFSGITYTFHNSGTVAMSRKGKIIDNSQYTIDGGVIKINGFPFTKFEDGSEDLNGGSAFGRLVKK